MLIGGEAGLRYRSLLLITGLLRTPYFWPVAALVIVQTAMRGYQTIDVRCLYRRAIADWKRTPQTPPCLPSAYFGLRRGDTSCVPLRNICGGCSSADSRANQDVRRSTPPP